MDLFLSFLTSRFTQLTVRTLTWICGVMFGADAVKTSDAQSAVSQGGSWLLLTAVGIAVDLVIHSSQYGKLMAWWATREASTDVLHATIADLEKSQSGDGVANVVPVDVKGASTTFGGTLAMLLLAGMVIVAAMAGFTMSGCAQNETNRAAQGMIDVQTHAKNVDDLVNGGSLTESQAKTLQGLIHDEQTAVNAYYDAIQAGDAGQLALAKAAIATTVAATAKELAKYALPPATPITLPVLTQPSTTGN